MKGLYQILAEDYREYQLKEPIKKKLVESQKPSKLAKEKALKEAAKPVRKLDRKLIEEAAKKCKKSECKECDDKDKEVIKGSEEEDKKPIKEDEKVEEEIEVTEEPVEEVEVEEVSDEEKEPTAIEKIDTVANLSKEEIEAEIAEMTDEEKEAIREKFEAIKNIAMDLFPEEVEVEEITEEIPEESIEEEPFEECEITSFRVTRIAPKVGAVMIEAQTKDGLKYITGKNFNETEKTLDEAEIVDDKAAASNRFKSLLK